MRTFDLVRLITFILFYSVLASLPVKAALPGYVLLRYPSCLPCTMPALHLDLPSRRIVLVNVSTLDNVQRRAAGGAVIGASDHNASPSMQPTWVALIAAGGAAVGWFVNHRLTVRREETRRRLEAQLKFVERQIEELYGPLAAALYEGRRTFRDLLDSLGRNYVFPADGDLPMSELRTWLFWAESEFLPRNEYIKTLLKTKAHLIYGGEFPQSYVDFLDHCNSWAVNHRRWKQQQVKYSWHSKINWPEDFETQVIETFQTLKRNHADLIGALTAAPSFQRNASGSR